MRKKTIIENTERVQILLYNAISLLVEHELKEDVLLTDCIWEICDNLGTTPTELLKFGIDFDEMF